MRKFYGKPAATIKYLRKRKRKRKEFTKRLDAYDYSTAPTASEDASDGKEISNIDELEEETSDESQEYNYYTTSDDEEETSSEENGNEDELIGYFRLRAFLALLLPIGVSASIGAFLFKQKLKGEISAHI